MGEAFCPQSWWSSHGAQCPGLCGPSKTGGSAAPGREQSPELFIALKDMTLPVQPRHLPTHAIQGLPPPAIVWGRAWPSLPRSPAPLQSSTPYTLPRDGSLLPPT